MHKIFLVVLAVVLVIGTFTVFLDAQKSFKEVSVQNSKEELSFTPKINVKYDLKTEKNSQKSVDEGHSPWRLDPVYVAQVFVSLKISPKGIEGEYAIKYEDIKVLKKTNEYSIVEINSKQTPVKKVYMKRLVRQDSTGIWTVVGYDPS